MKFNIPDYEVKNILEMHSKMKKNKSVLFEQTEPAVDPNETKLRESMKAGCLTNGSLKRDKTTGKVLFVKNSTSKPGVYIYFYGDMTYKYTDGSRSGKWECDEARTNAEKTNVELTKTEGNWKERKDITDTDANVENPQMYEKKVVNGVTLYRSKASAGITSGLTDDQKSIIKSWQDKGYKVRTDLSPEEAKTWKEVVVSPVSDGYFSQDLKMFFDPTTLTKGVGTGDTKVSVTTVIQNAVASRVPTDKKDCKQTIEAYYVSYKKKRPLEPNEFDALKTKTQACKNEFGGDWGALFPGGNKADEVLATMTGLSATGPDAKWKLQ